MALHEQCVGKSDEWYTPPHVFQALGCEFDIDVASPPLRQYVPTRLWLTKEDDGLKYAPYWPGFVWMNAPFGGRNGLAPWLDAFFEHGDGIALVPDRTSAPWWQRFAPRADVVLFVGRKIRFIAGFDDPEYGIERGKPGKSPAQGTALLAAGARGAEALQRAASNGLGRLFKPIAITAEE
ncbi:adenine methyltransferase [Rhodopseudomonas sp. AAP120]|uniref:DNA N-6-adenine-methyltransferase n=1 Tax=Rhodopseudomonas sp. AAP120 TaxID=1523430 RepID=UPI0006B8A1DA|nr:DNA N-6-adenine-methyltransferase [Rhodopseudomonas sp. AAP120]KPG01800.1 adenine methyltransferase [Rhodopseudomonas sp. AAP120]